MSSPIQIISTDFDGTLFAEFENPPVPVRLQEIIARLQARGAKWVINTGREMSSLMESLGRSGIDIEPDFLVLVEREIYVHEDSRYVALEPWNSRCSRDHAGLFERVRPDLPRIIDWISRRFHARLYEDSYSPFCLIANNNSDADIINAYIEDYCRTIPNLTVVRNDIYARLSHVAYSKGTALAEVARKLGVTRDQIFAVGDHLNDMPMLSREYARFRAAPANAIDQVKALLRREGGYVASEPHGYGVAEALEHYIEAGTPGGGTRPE